MIRVISRERSDMMCNFPPFSVLMTIYHRENPDFFEAAIHSVLVEQTLKPSELILVKDGKLTPELENRIVQLCEQYPRLRVFGLPENTGQGRASGFGLEKCQHDLVARMDSDDLSLPNRFESSFLIFRNIRIWLSWVDRLEFHQVDDGVFLRIVPTSPDDFARFARFRCPINNMTVVYRKSVVEKIDFFRPAVLPRPTTFGSVCFCQVTNRPIWMMFWLYFGLVFLLMDRKEVLLDEA